MARLSNSAAALVFLAFLVIPQSAAAQDVPQKLALGSYLTAAFFDTSITSYCSGAKTCHEQNPLLRPIVDRRGVVAAMTVKGAMHAGITLGLLRLSKNHPTRTFWLTVALTGAQVAVDVANVRTLRQ